MSGFYVLALLAIWALLTKWLWKGGRRLLDSEFGNRGVRVALVAAVAVFWLGGTFWEVAGKKMYWDARVRKLCAIDGGVKVYETVTLTPEEFDKWGKGTRILVERLAGSEDPYFYRMESKTIRAGDPSISRSHFILIRRSDGKVLGESVGYTRGGGDLPGPWHHSVYFCPPISNEHVGLKHQVFQKGSLNEEHE